MNFVPILIFSIPTDVFRLTFTTVFIGNFIYILFLVVSVVTPAIQDSCKHPEGANSPSHSNRGITIMTSDADQNPTITPKTAVLTAKPPTHPVSRQPLHRQNTLELESNTLPTEIIEPTYNLSYSTYPQQKRIDYAEATIPSINVNLADPKASQRNKTC